MRMRGADCPNRVGVYGRRTQLLRQSHSHIWCASRPTFQIAGHLKATEQRDSVQPRDRATGANAFDHLIYKLDELPHKRQNGDLLFFRQLFLR